MRRIKEKTLVLLMTFLMMVSLVSAKALPACCW